MEFDNKGNIKPLELTGGRIIKICAIFQMTEKNKAPKENYAKRSIRMEEVKKGQKWRHYKHPEREYEIIGVAKNSENFEEMIIYSALYSGEFPFGQLWARPKKEFLGMTIDKKTGKEVKRFTLIESERNFV